jgi:hypothetical protein
LTDSELLMKKLAFIETCGDGDWPSIARLRLPLDTFEYHP